MPDRSNNGSGIFLSIKGVNCLINELFAPKLRTNVFKFQTDLEHRRLVNYI